jgi:hypothetical protein
MTVAVLFCDERSGGAYVGLPDVEVWGISRDARLYQGPWPVVAHPPCERWGRYWFGGPTWISTGRPRKAIGDDGGCFAAALAAVRKWGGVIEHPEGSHAWGAHGLTTPPRGGGWIMADFSGGWTCCVEQGAYGHRARKATWLYAHDIKLPRLRWGPAPGEFVKIDLGAHTREQRARIVKTGVCQKMSKRQRAATPPEFRDVLLEMARSVTQRIEVG